MSNGTYERFLIAITEIVASNISSVAKENTLRDLRLMYEHEVLTFRPHEEHTT